MGYSSVLKESQKWFDYSMGYSCVLSEHLSVLVIA